MKYSLQKTKIPARGLKPPAMPADPWTLAEPGASKNQNPREGIETNMLETFASFPSLVFKKPKSPRGD